jgi:hypothetical protein
MAKYIETRDEISGLEKQKKTLKALQEKREMWLAGQMEAANETGKKTLSGSCHFYTLASVSVSDPLIFKEWVYADWEGRKHFLTNAASKDAVKTVIEDGEIAPPGVNYGTVRKVKVVRA